MSRIETSLPRQRLHRALIATLLIIGTGVAMLLAHSYETSHTADETLSVSVEVVHQADAAGELPLSAPTDRDAVRFSDSLALCLSIGLGCVTALLMVILRLRRPPTATAASPSPVTPRRRPVLPTLAWAPAPILTTLCISRV